MAKRKAPQISARKSPQQARSNDLVAAVLEAAVQVLVKQGATRFTMARVAEKAGVSVGSLYQYFPNKAAILFRLQSDEWRETGELLRSILEDTAHPPLQRLRRTVHAFVRSECDEAAVRGALNDAAPLYRDAPEAKAARAESAATLHRFVTELLPTTPHRKRVLAEDLLKTTISAVAKQFSEQPRSAAEIDAYADALADMLCAYVERLESPTPC
ncbi:MAG: TetR family transcriptional regulator [Myxococcales bacterium]|nr:TetR family transcriptional regulator [Myxococcales bacterium]